MTGIVVEFIDPEFLAGDGTNVWFSTYPNGRDNAHLKISVRVKKEVLNV